VLDTFEDKYMATIVHFEIPSDNIERSKKFYHELFGWKIDKWSGSDSTMEYWMITTTDDKGKEALHGGMMKRQNPQQGITNFIGVDSIDDYSSKAQQLGGKIVVPKTPVSGMGFFAVCLDTENNRFAIWESAPK
jgi:predicted enzyme related to lactoylglutathione lyase